MTSKSRFDWFGCPMQLNLIPFICDVCGEFVFGDGNGIPVCQNCRSPRRNKYQPRKGKGITEPCFPKSNQLASQESSQEGGLLHSSESNIIKAGIVTEGSTSGKDKSVQTGGSISEGEEKIATNEKSVLLPSSPNRKPYLIAKCLRGKATHGIERPNSLIEKFMHLIKEADLSTDASLLSSSFTSRMARTPRLSGKVKRANEAAKRSPFAAKPPLPPRHSRMKLSGNQRCNGEKFKTFHIPKRPILYNLHHTEKYPSNLPKDEAAWNGSFELLDIASPSRFFGGFRAHSPQRPFIIDSGLYRVSMQMPGILPFKFSPRCNVWPDIFQSDLAFGSHISLYFFPGKFERSLEKYIYLLDVMEEKDLALKSCMNGVDLLVFTSKRLHYAEELKWIPFLWGIFFPVEKVHAAPEARAEAFDVGITAEQPSPILEIKRLEKHEVAADCSGKIINMAAQEELLKKLCPNLVEVPVKSDPVLFHLTASAAKTGRRSNRARTVNS